MIKLTRLSGHEFWLNSDLIQHLEATPDTVITLLDGHRVVVRESPSEVESLHVAFRASILAVSGLDVSYEARAAATALRAAVPHASEGSPVQDDYEPPEGTAPDAKWGGT